ncbi:gustatory receptor for sugar taste 64e-like [Aphidius gifuensis]|uniref:gustatory receptor for sugar taste 64e-like n=1 Tax=Aphidius gifuensis TaxID=684658 RepID=UPI001CDBD328|nr:gustatory receptor for sugar taste 64e-like [Aphidius gifuensis]
MMSNQESFHTAIGPIIKVAQYFGILPISGVMKQSPSIMEFKIKSFRTYWTVSIIVALAIIFITVIVKIIKTLTIGNSNIREVITTGLTERYVWLNKRVKYLSRRKYQAIPWNQLRKNYAILSDLVKQTNNDLSPLIFLSYTNNFYFICVRLFNEIINTTGQFANLYIFVSYCYVIGRTIAVTLSASRINIESKEALPHIYLCQSSKFTDEANRLQNQLTYDDIGFTGMNFFSITRNFMLVTAGTIVTYELIMVQFHDQANK